MFPSEKQHLRWSKFKNEEALAIALYCALKETDFKKP
jgi:hypothetical protein